jgi:hypothetical protein
MIGKFAESSVNHWHSISMWRISEIATLVKGLGETLWRRAAPAATSQFAKGAMLGAGHSLRLGVPNNAANARMLGSHQAFQVVHGAVHRAHIQVGVDPAMVVDYQPGRRLTHADVVDIPDDIGLGSTRP